MKQGTKDIIIRFEQQCDHFVELLVVTVKICTPWDTKKTQSDIWQKRQSNMPCNFNRWTKFCPAKSRTYSRGVEQVLLEVFPSVVNTAHTASQS